MQFLGLMQLFAMLAALMNVAAVLAAPRPRSEIAAKTLSEIPQWHCLRYFKHDLHMMRRCRNHRVPMFRRPNRK